MDARLKKFNIQFNDAKKPQSLQTLNDLIEAAERIVEEGDVDQFVARTLAKESGYSLGSLVKRLGKIENIFLYAITMERQRHIKAVGNALEALDEHLTAAEFIVQMVDICIDALSKVSPRVMQYYEMRVALRAHKVSDVYSYSEEIIPYLHHIIAKNRSDTFRQFSDAEMLYFARAIFLFLERPFAEGDPIAGSKEHRAMAVSFLNGIMKK